MFYNLVVSGNVVIKIKLSLICGKPTKLKIGTLSVMYLLMLDCSSVRAKMHKFYYGLNECVYYSNAYFVQNNDIQFYDVAGTKLD